MERRTAVRELDDLLSLGADDAVEEQAPIVLPSVGKGRARPPSRESSGGEGGDKSPTLTKYKSTKTQACGGEHKGSPDITR